MDLAVRRRSNGCIVDFALSRIPLGKRAVEPEIGMPGFNYSVLTGICVGAGTIAFFLLFQKGGPLSAVPIILAAGAAMMAIAGIVFFREPASWPRLTGIVLAIVGLLLLRR